MHFFFQDLARDTRETKVHYSPSEKDGVFVVEVARGADSTPATIQIPQIQETSRASNNISPAIVPECNDYKSIGMIGSVSQGNEEVLVHPPPIPNDDDDDVLTVDEDGAVSMSSPKLNSADYIRDDSRINTGLSQSDLSISSSTGSNQGYCYGSQGAYTIETKGYQSCSPHHLTHVELAATPSSSTSIDTKPIIKDAILKQGSIDAINFHDTISAKPSNENIIAENVQENADLENLPIPPPAEMPVTECLTIENGKCSTGIVGDDAAAGDDGNGNYDSLMNLPDPPSCDEIKQLHDITVLDSNNFDSLPPPPPETIIETTIINGQS